jgi:hypothetical protein
MVPYINTRMYIILYNARRDSASHTTTDMRSQMSSPGFKLLHAKEVGE